MFFFGEFSSEINAILTREMYTYRFGLERFTEMKSLNERRDETMKMLATIKRGLLSLTMIGLIVLAAVNTVEAGKPKNIILMIADGQGFNTVLATEYYTGQPAPYRGFPVRLAASTFSASNNAKDNSLGYDPAKAWASFDYVGSNATDSAAAATALNTGIKVYDGRLNIGVDGKPLKTLAQYAAEKGKSTGAITSVMFCHATPAGVAAHTPSRDSYSDIAREMIYKSDLDVIMGCGHPLYNGNGQLQPNANYGCVGGEDAWKDITDADGANGFTLVETKEDFKKLANGQMKLPKKVLGIARSDSTLQYGRTRGNPANVEPETMNTNVPTLEVMSLGALRVLNQNPNGFYLMIEGGAVDWANHNNRIARMIEEEIDYNNSVRAVIDWVEKNSSWDETLLIVTADHETGFLWGAKGYFAPLGFAGEGNLPIYAYNSGGHTNSLVPLYAIGAGSEVFNQLIEGMDLVRGKYVDNTDIFRVMYAGLGYPLPEKAKVVTTSAPATTQAVSH
jgi:alkaline phosphatase